MFWQDMQKNTMFQAIFQKCSAHFLLYFCHRSSGLKKVFLHKLLSSSPTHEARRYSKSRESAYWWWREWRHAGKAGRFSWFAVLIRLRSWWRWPPPPLPQAQAPRPLKPPHIQKVSGSTPLWCCCACWWLSATLCLLACCCCCWCCCCSCCCCWLLLLLPLLLLVVLLAVLPAIEFLLLAPGL